MQFPAVACQSLPLRLEAVHERLLQVQNKGPEVDFKLQVLFPCIVVFYPCAQRPMQVRSQLSNVWFLMLTVF
jgi:hypothetical protein